MTDITAADECVRVQWARDNQSKMEMDEKESLEPLNK